MNAKTAKKLRKQIRDLGYDPLKNKPQYRQLKKMVARHEPKATH
jgi:hypothetical protein